MQVDSVQEGPICPFLLIPRKPEPPWTVERMFYSLIAQCTQALRNLETLLDKAEQDAALKNYDIGVLITNRLTPGQQPFIQQVQLACDYVKFAAARLSGQTPPKHEDAELTVGELRAASERRLLSQRAWVRRSTKERACARSASLGRPIRSSVAWTTCCNSRHPTPSSTSPSLTTFSVITAWTLARWTISIPSIYSTLEESQQTCH
jgi:hypothetical protein